MVSVNIVVSTPGRKVSSTFGDDAGDLHGLFNTGVSGRVVPKRCERVEAQAQRRRPCWYDEHKKCNYSKQPITVNQVKNALFRAINCTEHDELSTKQAMPPCGSQIPCATFPSLRRRYCYGSIDKQYDVFDRRKFLQTHLHTLRG